MEQVETRDITVRASAMDIKRGFGTTELTGQHETAAAAVAAREQAAVQARYIVALQRPRNVEQFRKRIMDMCLKPAFAVKVEYEKPVGKKWNPATGKEEEQYARGASIRFIEAALQLFGNVFVQTSTVFDNPALRIVRATVCDLETNTTYEPEVTIAKTVERKGREKPKGSGNWEPPAGRIEIGSRVNTNNEPVYIVLATEDEIQSKQNNLLSKAIRTNGERLLPWDIVEECKRTARQTVQDKDARDPDAAKREILDYFSNLGVEPIDIEAYLGYSISKSLQPKQIAELRAIYKTIANGESTWDELMAERKQTGSAELQEEVRDRKMEAAIREMDKQVAEQQGSARPPSGEQTGGVQPSGPTREISPDADKEGARNTGETPAAQAGGTDREIPASSGPAESAKASKPVFGQRPK